MKVVSTVLCESCFVTCVTSNNLIKAGGQSLEKSQIMNEDITYVPTSTETIPVKILPHKITTARANMEKLFSWHAVQINE